MASGGPGWELWRTFDAVMREGSLSAAARALGLTQPTAGRHMVELEAALGGEALFTRSARGLQPTETAHALVPHARAMAAAADALLRTASGPADVAAGVVRISASEVIGAEVLPPVLAGLHRAHPALSFELVLSNAASDLLRRDADLAVRMTRPRQQALLAKGVGGIGLGLYARDDYLARSGVPASLADLAGHALIGFDREEAALRAESIEVAALPAFTLRTDNHLAQLAATRAGFGVGVMQDALARREPALRPVLRDAWRARLETWVVMHEDLRATRRMRVTFDALVEGLTAHVNAGDDGG